MTESAESDWKQVLEKALPSANLRWSEFRNQHRVDVPASAIVAVLTALRDAGMDHCLIQPVAKGSLFGLT